MQTELFMEAVETLEDEARLAAVNAMVTVFWDVDPLPDHISVDGGEERKVF